VGDGGIFTSHFFNTKHICLNVSYVKVNTSKCLIILKMEKAFIPEFRCTKISLDALRFFLFILFQYKIRLPRNTMCVSSSNNALIFIIFTYRRLRNLGNCSCKFRQSISISHKIKGNRIKKASSASQYILKLICLKV
jgi:hypothetical protein